jgi:hypothetical protein
VTIPTAQDAPVRPKAGQGKKYFGLTRTQLYIGGGVFVAALAYILWKRHQSAAAAAGTGTGASTGTGTTSSSSDECTDANGNPIDCDEEFAQELAGVSNALDQLGANSGGGGSGTVGTVGTTPSDGGTGAASTTQPTSTGTTTSTATASASPAASSSWSYPAPSNLKITNPTKTGYYLTWSAVKGPSGQVPASYTVATYNQSGTEVNSHDTVPGSTQTAEYGKGGTGLPKGTYHTNVWANGGPIAPPHASTPNITLAG